MMPVRPGVLRNDGWDFRVFLARLVCRRFGWGMLCLVLVLVFTLPARADRWSLTPFTTAQGLPSDSVTRAIEGRYGFIWFGTSEGLSRFDGQNFRNFGVAQGLGDPLINDLLEGPDGSLWVGSEDAVYHFDPAGGGRFQRLTSPDGSTKWSVHVLLLDRHGTLWCGGNGLYFVDRSGGALRFVRKDLPIKDQEVYSLLEDRQGAIWAGAHTLVRLSRDGTISQVPLPHPPDGVGALVQDRAGRIWVGTARGLFLLVDQGGVPGRPEYALVPTPRLQPLRHWVDALLERRDGTIWVGTRDAGIVTIDPGAEITGPVRSHDEVPASASPRLDDRAGNLWIRVHGRGLLRKAPEGFVSYGLEEGLTSVDISSILRLRSGTLVVIAHGHVLHRLVGDRFVAVRPDLPKLFLEGWGSGQFDLEDCEGKWWIPTGEGLFRFPRTHRLEDLSHTPPEAHFTEKNGLAGRDVFRLFEDSKGNLWISTLDAAPENLTRWERSTKRFLRYGEKDGLPVASSPTAFLESKRGDLWIGHSAGHVTRRRNGRFTPVRVPEGMARSIVNRLLFDRRGRLWIATTRGLFLCNDPSADSPEIVGFGNGGFSSAGIRWIEEDSFGRLYAVTSRGIDRFDPDTGRIWHFTTSQGIPLSSMLAGLRDGNGNLWFGGIQGVMRLAPLPENSELSPPVVRIDGLRIAGRSLPFSATGEQAVGGLTLAPTERQIEITWVGISQDAAEPPTFEYRLQPSDDWSPPTQRQSLTYARLAPGRYTFQVRARSAKTGPPAAVEFEVLAPFWQAWWFLSLVALAVSGAAGAFYRQRVNRRLALEQQRTRIAMDLHDELGSGLGSIGLLADLAADPSLDNSSRGEFTRAIGDTAVELGTSLSDILRSLRPGEATIESLGRLLAERARRLFPGTDATLSLDLPEVWPTVSLPIEIHRNVLLIALEALHNAARHSGAGHVGLSLRLKGRLWNLEVEDNGLGMEQGAGRNGTGLGLENIKRRAAAIGAELEYKSAPAEGTLVRLAFDPAPRSRLFGWPSRG